MKVEEIRIPNPGWKEAPLLAVVVFDPWDQPTGTTEHSVTELVPQSEPMQVLAMALPKNHVVAPHTHISQERTVCTTQETLLVLSGRLSVDFYRANRDWFCRRVIGPGDVVILLNGGHGLTALTPTRLIEVKTGPYYGRGLDKIDYTPVREMVPLASEEI